MARGLVLRKVTRRRGFANSVAPTGWGDSTYAETQWERSRNAASRWAYAGAVLGVLVALLVFAPAEWVARAVASGTNQRVLLSDARGTWWSGSAVLVFTGGEKSRDATSLPGRIEWSLGMAGTALSVKLRHACCLNDTITLKLKPGLGKFTATLVPSPDWVGQWPSATLAGFGTPFNTLQLGGQIRLKSSGFTIDFVKGHAALDGSIDIELMNASSRLATLDPIGSYRFTIAGSAARPGEAPQMTLSTLDGALQLSGTGTWTPTGARFRGVATVSEADLPALTNLLSIIGQRTGARSVISIG